MRHCTQCGAATPEDARFCPRCGAPVVALSAADPMIGKVISERYKLVEKIGQGGSGAIYRAEHTTLNKRVAVKLLHAQLSTDDTALERFRREATTVGALENEHILQVLDYGRSDDQRLFFAMEFLEGETLTKVVEREKQLPIDRAVDILSQMCEGLTEAHGLGYVHRDLRPRNVFLVTKRGRADFVKLLDFGLAKLILPDAEAKQTAMGMTFGDPRYMSPEQARGETIDRRSDIYSLGAIAFEMLTGSPPYTGSGTFEILQQHLDAPVPKVRDRRGECPQWLDAAVQRALAKKPSGRYDTVAQFLEAIRTQPKAAAPAKAPVAAAPAEPAPVVSMGPVSTPAPAATPAAAARPPSLKDTQMLTTLAPKPRERRETPTQPPASGSVEVTPPPSKMPEAANVPSVVVEGSSNEKTVPSVPAKLQPATTPVAPAFEQLPTTERSSAAPLPPPPAASDTVRKRKADPTGEWFSSDSQPVKTIAGPSYDDEFDDIPRTNRAPLIIGGVAGGLILVGVVVIALLPKAEHKPMRGEAPATAPSAVAEKPITPPPVAAPPSAIAEKPATPPSAVAAKPVAPPPVVTPTAAPPSAVAQKPIASPPVAAMTPPPVAKPIAKPAPVAEKPAAKPAPVERVAKEPPARVEKSKPAEKPTRVASAERATAAPVERRKKGAPADGFKDPFANDAPKATAPSAGESAQAEFFVKLGRQKLNSSDLGAAATNFNKAREYDARSSEAIAGLGEVAFEQGDYNGAAVHLKQALKIAPNRSRYLVLLGQAYYKLGKPKDAAVEYKKALRIDPNNQEAQHSLEVAERKLSGG
jgi:serine/threonine-protein kinase